jgi:hypothetical protein
VQQFGKLGELVGHRFRHASTSAPPSALRTTCTLSGTSGGESAEAISTGVPPADEASTITGPCWPTRASTWWPCSRAASSMRWTVSLTPYGLWRSTRIEFARRSTSSTPRPVHSEAITTARLPVIQSRNGMRRSPTRNAPRGWRRSVCMPQP